MISLENHSLRIWLFIKNEIDMNMKSISRLTMIALLSVGLLSSCKSKVTLESVRKQQSDVLVQLEDTREELLKLSTMKEQFSVDHRDARVKVLEKRRKQVNKDIANIKGVQSTGTESGKKEMIDGLEKQLKDIDREISDLKKLNKEDWAMERDTVITKINDLQMVVSRLTENLNEFKDVEE